MMRAVIAAAFALLSAPSRGVEFYCSNTATVQIAQAGAEESAAAAVATRGARRPKNRIERFDILQAYTGQPVLMGSAWLTACMRDPLHGDTREAFGVLLGLNPDAAAALARNTGLVDRGIRMTRDMYSCLINNAPAVGYSTAPIYGPGIKPCF